MNNKKINILIYISFILISIISCSILLKSHIIVGADDMQFHFKRITELKESLLNLNINPHYSFNYFHGSAVMSFYPYVNIFLFAVLQIFIGSIFKVFYIYYGLQVLISLLLAYLSCLSYSGNKWKSYMFSIVYSLSTPLFFYQFGNMDLGEVTAFLALPLIFFGTMKVIKYESRGFMIFLGFFLIIISHVLSFFVVLLLVFLLCIVNIETITKFKIFKILKNILISILSTSFVWLYPLYLLLINRFKIASPGRIPLKGLGFNRFIKSIFLNEINPYVSIVGIVAVVLGLCFIKKLNNEDKKLLFISVLIILICSNLFPWKITDISVFKAFQIFQFTTRFYVIPNLLLSYLFVDILTTINLKKNYRNIIYVIVLFIVILLQIGNQLSLLNMAKDRQNFSLSYVSNKSRRVYDKEFKLKRVLATNKNGKAIYKLIDNDDYLRLNKTYTNTVGLDYYPKNNKHLLRRNFVDINNNVILGQNGLKRKLKNIGYNHFEFYINKKSNYVDLPIAKYKGEKLNVTLNGKPTSYYNHNGKLELRGNFKGKYNLKLSERNMIPFTVTYCLSLLFLICYLCRQFILKNKII